MDTYQPSEIGTFFNGGVLIIYLVLFCAAGLSFSPDLYAGPAGIGQLPLVYVYNRDLPSVSETETIATAGTIKTISAFWEFEGEVSLEASANGGISYTKIICGLPLSDGFISGNQLRFRISVSPEGTLKKLVIGYTDTSGENRIFRDPLLSSFKYHKLIRISGGDKELFNYPLKISISKETTCSGNVEPDFKDVRFTAADGQTPLDYFLERISSDNLADFWVKIPQIPKEGASICLYYGNKKAVLLSKPENVFSFFDDFNAPDLDETKWLIPPEFRKGYSFQEGYLRLSDCSVISRKFKMKEAILEFKAKAEKNTAIIAVVRGKDMTNLGLPFEEIVYSSSYPGAEHTIAVNDVAKLNIGRPIEAMVEYIYKVIVSSKGITFERYGKNYEKQAEIHFLEVYKLDEGYIGLKTNSALLSGGSAFFDWVRVRPYTEIEPKITDID